MISKILIDTCTRLIFFHTTLLTEQFTFLCFRDAAHTHPFTYLNNPDIMFVLYYLIISLLYLWMKRMYE